MILDTSGIREGHSTLRLISEMDTVRDTLPPFSEPVLCDMEIDRNEAIIVAKCRFSGLFELQCGRCLEMYKHQVSDEIKLILQEADGRSGQANEGESVDYYFNSQDYLIDISPSVYDEIMTSLPLKSLCSETCVGIVLESKNSVKVANPEKNEGDPRWEALRKLQKKTQF